MLLIVSCCFKTELLEQAHFPNAELWIGLSLRLLLLLSKLKIRAAQRQMNNNNEHKPIITV